MKSLMNLYLLTGLSLTLWTVAVSAQDFVDPGYTGVTQFAQWSSFTHATTNSGVNTPQWEAGSPGLELKQFNPAIITGGGNIYSYSSDLSFELTGSSATNLGKICLQLFTWGDANALSNETVRLVLDGGMELEPTSSTNFYQFIDDQGAYGEYHTLGYKLEWELGNNAVTNYSILFETIIHSSLDGLRLNTQAAVPMAPTPMVELAFSGNEPVVQFETVPGVAYQVLCSESLTNALADWTIIQGPISGDGSTFTSTNSALNPQQFYTVESWLE
ncbi:hypothetical protein P4C99_08790 [Pontiellaceae bacterium B1224]|nr:hypothetical protein [Pontiellaceae bacterium B1224]